MRHQILVSDEELSELETVLASELVETRGELRRTRNPAYRKQVNHHLQVVRHIHDQVEQAIGVGSRSIKA